MNSMIQKVLVGACLLIVGSAGTYAVAWLASAEDSHDTTASEEVEQTQMGEVVKSNTAILEKLAERQIEKDAAREATIMLCKAGDISKCSICRGVGVYDAPACEK